jgi:hypothetical protein
MEVKSQAISNTLSAIDDISDCWAFRMRYGKHDAFVFMFPSINRGFAWEAATGRWLEWRDWDAGPVSLRISSAYFWREYGRLMVGSVSGKIGYLSDESTGDFGSPIKIEIVTGHTSHNSPKKKWSKSASFSFAKSGAESGFVRISVKDDNGDFRIIKDASLVGTHPTVTVRSLGVYTYRQWKIEYTGSQKFSLVSAQEDFDYLEMSEAKNARQ